MKINIFGVEEKSFTDKKDGKEVIYYRAYGYKPTKHEKGVGGIYTEIKIDKTCCANLGKSLDSGVVTCEFEFDEFGRVTDWVVL